MLLLAEKYRPITAAPFRRNVSYCEIPPCAALRPYIRCFWGTDGADGGAGNNSVVIPDTCSDIIFKKESDGSFSADYCGINDRAFCSESAGNPVFGIRFYPWSAALFSDSDLSGTRNAFFPAEEYFGKPVAVLCERLPFTKTLAQRAKAAESELLKKINLSRENPDFLNTVFYILENMGQARISELSRYAAVSEKTLERLFRSSAGLSPKALSSLVRYQLLYRKILFSPDYSLLDAVEEFGYTDQAHLLNDFKKRHGMTPREAKRFAFTESRTSESPFTAARE